MADLDDAPAAAAPARAGRAPGRSQDAIAELRFLHRLLGLATTAQTWEELLETVVDGTRDALAASVSSLFLLDARTGVASSALATNELDRFQIGRRGRPVRGGDRGPGGGLPRPWRPSPGDVAADPRFLRCSGHRPAPVDRLDALGAAHLADQVVGILNCRHRTPRVHEPRHRTAVGDDRVARRRRREGPPQRKPRPRSPLQAWTTPRRAHHPGHARAPLPLAVCGLQRPDSRGATLEGRSSRDAAAPRDPRRLGPGHDGDRRLNRLVDVLESVTWSPTARPTELDRPRSARRGHARRARGTAPRHRPGIGRSRDAARDGRTRPAVPRCSSTCWRTR